MSHRHDDTVPPGLGRRLGRRRRGTLQTTRDSGSASRNSGSRGEVSVDSLAGYTIGIYASASPSPQVADHAVTEYTVTVPRHGRWRHSSSSSTRRLRVAAGPAAAASSGEVVFQIVSSCYKLNLNNLNS